jgi:hypothetical protein
MYNAEFEMLLKTKSITASGAKPLAIHFALEKPFDVGPDDYRWEYLCYRPKMVSIDARHTNSLWWVLTSYRRGRYYFDYKSCIATANMQIECLM